MNLNEEQRSKVAAWISEGLKLSEIQNRISADFGVRLTYMDVRLLVDDLKLTPKDTERAKAPPQPIAATPPKSDLKSSDLPEPKSAGPGTAPAGGVSLSVDHLARPGAVVSGKVTFSDGNTADWYFDQMGRLGLAPQKQGYRPPATDLQQFQSMLESELSKLGY